MRITVAPLDEADVVAAVVPVTSPARTVVDCARTLPPRDALAIADAALASGRVTAAALAVAVDRAKGWPGAPRARRVVALADGRRETALESWSAWAFHEQGLGPDLWQVEVCDAVDTLLGRVDCWWSDGVAGEADGRAKYRVRALERGGTTADDFAEVLHAERLRETGLRRTGALLVRWEARDVLVPQRTAALADHVVRQRTAARALVFEGRLRLP